MIRSRITAAVAILAGVLILGLLAYSYVLTNQRDRARAQVVAEQKAHETTVANYRRAKAEAERQDAENRARVEAEQRAANERISNEYEARIAAVRAQYDRLLRERAGAGGSRPGNPGVPQGGTTPRQPDGAAPKGGLPTPPGFVLLTLEDALIASEQAIQLEELQRWVRQTMAIINAPPVESPQAR